VAKPGDEAKKMPLMVIGIPWYSRKNWSALKILVSDASELHETFDEWRASAGNVESRMRQEGYIVKRINIDPKTFPEWCKKRGLKTDAEARSEFAIEAAREGQSPADQLPRAKL
jgi:hypothetical protein